MYLFLFIYYDLVHEAHTKMILKGNLPKNNFK